MKWIKRIIIVGLVLGVLGGLSAGMFVIGYLASESNPRLTVSTGTAYTDVVLSAETIQNLVNQYRMTNGLVELKPDNKLCIIANSRLPQIKRAWSHLEMTNQYGDISKMIHYRYFGENLAKDFARESDVLNSWLESPTHKENIDKREYTHTCVAAENTYVVQIFASY